MSSHFFVICWPLFLDICTLKLSTLLKSWPMQFYVKLPKYHKLNGQRNELFDSKCLQIYLVPIFGTQILIMTCKVQLWKKYYTFLGSEYKDFKVINNGGTPFWKATLRYWSTSFRNKSPVIRGWNEPHHEKTCLQGLPPGKTKTGMRSTRS